ncbi:MAG: GDSL-type esterase/lipase family protein, partial [Deltaproteobacteria bacterium]|nr:GDSL-type esterase/lipase family protein [Deltaproteobacteria bacterium]
MEPNEKTIVLLGDSLFAYHDGWDKLDPEAKVVNLGRGGDNSFGVMGRVKDACGHKPEIIFLEVGINDLLQTRYFYDLIERHVLIWRTVALMSPLSRLVVCSLLPINRKKLAGKNPSVISNHIEYTNQKLSHLAKIFRVEYVDVHKALAGSDGFLPDRMTQDGVHLLGPGYEAFVECLKPWVTQVI